LHIFYSICIILTSDKVQFLLKIRFIRWQTNKMQLIDEVDTDQEDGPLGKRRISSTMHMATMFAALGGLLFGFHTGGISSAMVAIKQKIQLDHFWQELLVSITVGVAALSSLVGGALADCFGRKFVIRCAGFIFLLGSILFIGATDKTSLLISRIIIGLATGLTCSSVPLYIAECSPAHSRGFLVSMNSVFITGGNFISNFLCAAFGSYSGNGWRYAFAFACVPALLQVIFFHFLPESPLWYLDHGRVLDARDALKRLRPNLLDANKEYELIKARNDRDEQMFLEKGRPSIWTMLKSLHYIGIFMLGMSMFMFQQICGINAVLYYSATIIQMAGVETVGISLWLAAASSGLYFICTIVSLLLVERFRRRLLMLGSLLMVFISLIIIASGFHLIANSSPEITIHDETTQSTVCGGFLTCESCVNSQRCGFCYENRVDKNGSCLPTTDDTFQYSAVGKCSQEDNAFGPAIWAPEWCPSEYAWIPIVGLLAYLISFAPGLGMMPWVVNAELYPRWLRSIGVSLATTANFLFNLIVTLPFLSTVDLLGKSGTFYLFTFFTLCALVTFFLFLPETSGRHLLSPEEIQWRLYSFQQKPFNSSSHSSNSNFRYMKIRAHNRQFYNEDEESSE
ncbi:Proton myo-inositol cotransporter, partial [Trichinella britovi]